MLQKPKNSLDFEMDAQDVIDFQFQQCLKFFDEKKASPQIVQQPQFNSNQVMRQEPEMIQQQSPQRNAGQIKKKQKEDKTKYKVNVVFNNYASKPLKVPEKVNSDEMIDLQSIRSHQNVFNDEYSSQLDLVEQAPKGKSKFQMHQPYSQQVSSMNNNNLKIGQSSVFKGRLSGANNEINSQQVNSNMREPETEIDKMKEFLAENGIKVNNMGKANVQRLYSEMYQYLKSGVIPTYLYMN